MPVSSRKMSLRSPSIFFLSPVQAAEAASISRLHCWILFSFSTVSSLFQYSLSYSFLIAVLKKTLTVFWLVPSHRLSALTHVQYNNLGCFPFATQLILSVNHHTSLQDPHFHTKAYFKFCVFLVTIFFFTILPTPVRNSCVPYICTVTRTNIHDRKRWNIREWPSAE